jgi:hypothetical protein
MVSPAPLLTRNNNLIQDIIIVDGIPGCGKTMASAIISSLDRVELMKFCYDIEYYCILNHYNNINLNVAQSMIKLKVDQLIYDLMMSREVNFRYSDLSSVFKTSNKLRYFKRIFQKGDQAIPDRIKKEKPILHLTTHMMSAFNLPILKCSPSLLCSIIYILKSKYGSRILVIICINISRCLFLVPESLSL